MKKKCVMFVTVLIVLISGFSVVSADTHVGIIYNGTIHEYPITMTLTFFENGSVSGKYHYTKYKTEMPLQGEIKGREISLFVFNKDNDKTETFTGTFTSSKTTEDPLKWFNKVYRIAGTWQHNNKSLPFDLAVDPLADMTLSCDEMQRYPDRIFGRKHGYDLGSGHGSPTGVDYRCKGGLASLSFLKKLEELTETVRSEEHHYLCSGSIIHAQWRYYHFRLLEAGLAPDLNIQHSKEFDRYRPFKKQQNYFRLWAYQSLYNFELYNAFWTAYHEAVPKLIRHYKTEFNVSEEKASEYTEYSLRHYLGRAAGSYSSTIDASGPTLSLLDELISKPSAGVNDIKELIPKTSKNDLDQALKTALLNEKKSDVIHLFLDKGADINTGDESALFFALRNKKNVNLLLKQGADPNYENAFGKTALYYAVAYNDHELTTLLINHGADVNHTYKSKAELDKIRWSELPFYQSVCSMKHTRRTPLMHAAQHSDIQMLKLLISRGADVTATDETGATVKDFALMDSKDDNVTFLNGQLKKTE